MYLQSGLAGDPLPGFGQKGSEIQSYLKAFLLRARHFPVIPQYHEHVEFTQSQISQQFNSVERFNLAVKVSARKTLFAEPINLGI